MGLHRYAKERSIPHSRLGKLIVAQTREQESYLRDARDNALRNGVTDLKLLTQSECEALEPEVRCIAGLHSPSSGIIDSQALMAALQADVEAVRLLSIIPSRLSPLAVAFTVRQV